MNDTNASKKAEDTSKMGSLGVLAHSSVMKIWKTQNTALNIRIITNQGLVGPADGTL